MFYKRYQAGECEGVWRELMLAGEDVYSGVLRDDAESVAREFVERVHANMLITKEFLVGIDFEFATPSVITPPSAETRIAVEQIDEQMGAMPLVLKAWWEQMEAVDFRQSEEQYQSGIGPQCDGLVPTDSYSILSPSDALRLSKELVDEIRAHNEEVRKVWETNPELRDDLVFNDVDEGFLLLGPYATNCEHKGFSLPHKGLDGRYYNDGGGDKTFADDMRLNAQFAGLRFMFIGKHLSKETGEIAYSAKVPATRREEILAELLPKMQPV